jgi:glyoxylase-like metal-dependent hydrolase (beta-lactamase superfamily II)
VIDPAELGVAAQVLSVRYAQRQVRRREVFHDYGSYGLPDATLDMDYNFFHYDHIGYLALFSEAEVVSGGAEHDYWFGKRAAGALDGEFTTEADLAVVDSAQRDGRLRLVRDSERVSDSVAVRPVGGHCPGELLVAVRTEGRPLLLASDAAHFYEQLEHEWPFFAFTDLGEMRRALTLINQLARDFGATVVPGHDARTRQRFPALPGAARDVAVVLS